MRFRFLAAVLFAAMNVGASAGATTPKAQSYDCSRLQNGWIEPGKVVVHTRDSRSAPTGTGLTQLRDAACITVDGARLVGTGAPNVATSMTFVLVDKVLGSADQAAFVGNNTIEVGQAVLSKYGPDGVLFVLGHELGHRQARHDLWNKTNSAAAVAGAGVAGIATTLALTKRKFKRAALAGAVAFSARCIQQSHLANFEITADAFGVKVLEQAGMGTAEAKAAAVAVMNSHPEQKAETCINAVLAKNPHPSSKKRISAIEAIPTSR